MSRSSGYQRSYLLLSGIVLLSALLRLYALHHLPPGLHQDEAFDGFDALRILYGEFPLYFEANNGREPAFMYLLAPAIWMLGQTPFTLRWVAALAGVIAIPLAYRSVEGPFGRALALLAACIMAATIWPIAISHLATRPSLLPAALGLCAWLLPRAWRRDGLRDWLLAGGVFGLSLYVYLPARLALVAPGLLALTGWFSGINRRRLVRGGALFSLGYGLTALPLGWYALGHWEIIAVRLTQVSILKSALEQGHLIQTLLDQCLTVAKMFLVEGDANLRHNIPGRPVFDAVMGFAAALGLGLALLRLRERRIQWILAWVAVFLLPTLLSIEAPHFLRGIGVWPLLAVLPALGIEATCGFVRRRAGRLLGTLVGAALIGASLLITVRDYFWRGYLTSQEAYFAFDGFSADIASAINSFTGSGWHKAGSTPAPLHGEVWVDSRLIRFSKTVEFLTPEVIGPQAPVHVLPSEFSSPLPAGRAVRLIVVPGEESRYVGLLPPRSLIDVQDGPLARLIYGLTPHLFFRTITALPANPAPHPLACFSVGLHFLEPEVIATDDEITITLLWQSSLQPLPINGERGSVFVHLYEEGVLTAQDDSLPANGVFQFTWLRLGDIIQDMRTIPLPDTPVSEGTQIGVGVYDWGTGERASVTDCAGHDLGDEFFLNTSALR